MKDEIELIEEEDWTKAEGVVYTGVETNSALTKRDYFKNCRCPHKIAVIKGYFIWWCSVHHQPLFHCQSAKDKLSIADRAAKFREEILKM